MPDSDIVEYKFLILDDKLGESSWGEITKGLLEVEGFEAIHLNTIESATTEVARLYYDVFIVDMDLGGREDGMDFQREIRNMGMTQPILFVTGNEKFLESAIFNYSDAFSRGPVIFYNKNSSVPFLDVVNEAINRTDPIRRSLYLMDKAGYGDQEYTIDNNTIAVRDLLLPNADNNALIRSLRESLQQLLLEMRREEG